MPTADLAQRPTGPMRLLAAALAMSAAAAPAAAGSGTPAGGAAVGTTGAKPHFVFLLIDDLGFHDTQVHNPESPSPAIGGLAKEGIILQRHYVYMVSRGPQPLAAPCLSDLAALRLTLPSVLARRPRAVLLADTALFPHRSLPSQY